MRILATSFFRRPADVVAPDLLGATIVSTLGGRTTAGMITEVEAYLGLDDPASHAFRGRLHSGNANLYAAPGTWYVYRSYGIHWCANLVCGPLRGGGAVLVRAMIPVDGVSLMRRRRGGVAEPDLTNGPGKLCQALGITRRLDGWAMVDSPVRVGRASERPAGKLSVTPRIGITKAVDWPLRFVLRRLAQ